MFNEVPQAWANWECVSASPSSRPTEVKVWDILLYRVLECEECIRPSFGLCVLGAKREGMRWRRSRGKGSEKIKRRNKRENGNKIISWKKGKDAGNLRRNRNTSNIKTLKNNKWSSGGRKNEFLRSSRPFVSWPSARSFFPLHPDPLRLSFPSVMASVVQSPLTSRSRDKGCLDLGLARARAPTVGSVCVVH